MTIKVKMRATEMVDADVAYISLVKKAATRLPFRVTKSESDDSTEESPKMSKLDNLLARVFKIDGESAEAPRIVGVAIKSDNVDHLKPQLEKLGLSVDAVIEKDGCFVFKQEDEFDFEAEDADLMGFASEGSDVVTLVANVQKSFTSYTESEDFMENLAQGGFFPSLRVAMDALSDTIWNILYASGMDKAEAMTALEAAITDFGAYAGTLYESLPEMAFKLDKELITKAEAEDGEAPAGEDAGGEEEEGDAEDADVGAAESEGEGDEPNEEGTDDADAEGDDDAAASGEEEGEEEEAGDAAAEGTAVKQDTGDEAPAWAKTLTESVQSLATKVDSLAQKSDELGNRVEKAEELANSAKETTSKVSQRVLGTQGEDTVVVDKEDDGDGDDPWEGVLDDIPVAVRG